MRYWKEHRQDGNESSFPPLKVAVPKSYTKNHSGRMAFNCHSLASGMYTHWDTAERLTPKIFANALAEPARLIASRLSILAL